MKKVPELMDVRSAAYYLGLSRETLYKYLLANQVPAFRLGNRWRIKKSVLDRWMEEQSEKSRQRASGATRRAVRESSVRKLWANRFMTARFRPYRKVLIVEDEPSIRNVLYVLLASMGYEAEVAHSSERAFAMISRERFDAVLLDLRCSYAPAEEVISKVKRIQPSLIGRVLVITGEVQDAETMRMIERHSLAEIPRRRLAQELRARLCRLLGVAKPPLYPTPP